MFKQFLSKLPRKSSKADSSELARANSCPAGGSASSSSQRLSNGAGVSAKRTTSAVFPASGVLGIEPLIPFKDVPVPEKMKLFVSKVSLCCVTFDFTDPSKNSVEKDVKKQTLLEILGFVASNVIKFSEPAILAMCKMCAVNLFRAFPPNHRCKSKQKGENDDDEPVFDPAWPHLQIIYELLLKFINSPCLDLKLSKKYMDQTFVLRLLELFESEDPRERDNLKTILHRVYGKFMVHRPFIRKSMSNIFYGFVFETEKHNGIAELLEVFGSIISGFALPLKEEHKVFLWKILVPLHKPKNLGIYFQQLSYCITQFVEKDPKLASIVVNELLKFWPITNSQKEVLFLGELEEVLESINMVEFQKVMVPLFSRIAWCVNSSHFQVAERALFLWNNDQIVNLIGHNRQVILPIIFPALEKNAQSHWNQSVLNLTSNVKKLFSQMDETLFISCYTKFKEEQEKESAVERRRSEVRRA